MTKTTGNFLQQLLSPFKSKQNGNESDLERIAAHEQKNFTFQTLASATKDFHRDHKLGEGGFGPVFKGKLSDGREIAVKKLSTNSNQGKKEFTNEAKLLARVQHRNVVSLVGYCVHGAEKLLVYEYVANESLDKFIFSNNPERRILLDWKRRFDIIVAVARGLLYLHEDCHCKIIHRDIKASNILLDDKWIPKIADFGMARLFPEGQTHVNTRIAGTNGYMAPEYLMHGLLTPKADVFSFGVVILEMISGQKNSTFNPSSDAKSLLEWAYNLYKEGKSSKVMDPTLASSAIHPQVEMCVQIGLLCTQSDPHLRPDMRRVGIMLSKKPGTLEEPTRPGYPGSRYRRRSCGPGATSSTVEVTGESSSRISSFATDTSSHSRCASASASASTSCHSNVSASASASASTSCHSNVNMDTRKKQSMQG